MKVAIASDWEELTINEALADAVEYLADAKIDSAHLDARLLLAHVLDVGREYLTLHGDAFLAEEEWHDFEALLARRVAREPMSHILGQREFWSLNFTVGPDVLDPRPDSETLIEAVLDYHKTRENRLMIADFGVGSGCLLLSLLSEFPNAHGLGVDISESALKVATRNAQSLGLAARSHFHYNKWGEGVIGRYDVIVSNPPYIPEAEIATLEPEVAQYEPHLALNGGKDGLKAYRELLPHIKRLLAPDGVAVLEFGQGQADDVCAIARQSGLKTLEVRADLGGVIRCAVLTHKDD